MSASGSPSIGAPPIPGLAACQQCWYRDPFAAIPIGTQVWPSRPPRTCEFPAIPRNRNGRVD